MYVYQALCGLFGVANGCISQGRQLEGLRLRLSQFVQNDILLSGEGLLPLFADSALVSFPVRS